MAKKEVLLLGNEKLWKKSSPIPKATAASLDQAKEDLRDTLKRLKNKHGMGRALAAPQIGYFKQIIYYRFEGQSFFMINPEIVSKSSEKFQVWDSCFSFDLEFFVKIPRHRKIEVKYLDGDGVQHREEVSGGKSELFQHEIDHLHGKLATDHLQEPKNIIMREEWERRIN
ncbi:MAG: peptide deformylase [Candidatus Bipolaricaulia bacterium]